MNVERDMVNHPPGVLTQELMEEVRSLYHEVGYEIDRNVPSRELSLAATNLEQSLMWFMAHLARMDYDARMEEQ